jgi:hypothetical protein
VLVLLAAVLLAQRGVPKAEEDAAAPQPVLLQLKRSSHGILAPSAVSELVPDPSNCSEPIPIGEGCPAECPYSQLVAGSHCLHLCLLPEACEHTHPARTFPDKRAMACEPACGKELKDRIPGCKVCERAGVCMQCDPLFELQEDGTCKAIYGGVVHNAYYGIAVVAVLLGLGIYWLASRPAENQPAVDTALQERRHQVPLRNGQPLSVIWTSLMSDQDISGIGMCLYFRAILLLGVVGTILAVACYLGSEPGGGVDPCGPDGRPPTDERQEGTKYALTHVVSLSAAYLVVMTAMRYFLQQQLSGSQSSLSLFALEVDGLPTDWTDPGPMEEAGAWGLSAAADVVGVSVCYEYEDFRWTFEAAAETYPDEPDVPLWWEDAAAKAHPAPAQAKWGALTSQIQGSGTAIAVFATEQATATALEHGLQLQGQTFSARRVPAEPEGVRWHDFHRHPVSRMVYLKGLFQMLGVVLLWAAAYVPYAVTYMKTSRIPGVQVTMLMDLGLGALIGIGNAVVSLVVEAVVDEMQLRYKPYRDVMVLLLAYSFYQLNTVADITMTVQLAQGVTLDDAFSQPVGEHLGYGRVLARELLALLMPGYLVVPYLLEPVARVGLPYWLGKVIARSDKHVCQPVATAWLKSPPMELSWRYADLVNNLSLCWFLLFLASPRAWEAQVFYLVFLCVLVVVDRVTVLRDARAWHTSRSLHRNFCWLMGIPTGVLALAIVFWLRQFTILGATDQRAVYGGTLFFHGVLFFVVLKGAVLGEPPPSGETYQQVVDRHRQHQRYATYFNTNPVFVLRHAVGKSGSKAPVWSVTRPDRADRADSTGYELPPESRERDIASEARSLLRSVTRGGQAQ